MTPSVTYSVVPRKNPRNKDEEPKYYAQAQARGEANIRSMAEEIEKMCTLTFADISAVLIALETTVSKSLANGEIVRLGELGSFQLSLQSVGALHQEDFIASAIKKSRILFRPGKVLTLMQKSLNFEKVPKLEKKKAGPEGPEVAKEGQTDPEHQVAA